MACFLLFIWWGNQHLCTYSSNLSLHHYFSFWSLLCAYHNIIRAFHYPVWERNGSKFHLTERVRSRERPRAKLFLHFGHTVLSGEQGGRTGKDLDVLIDFTCDCDCSDLRVISWASRRAKITPGSPKHDLSDPHKNAVIDTSSEDKIPLSIQFH